MITPSYKATGCGCGGGASASSATCGCGGAQCDSGQDQGIVRPRFFAGQLLTEDDLQLLADYVGHKNRLHNRYLFGAGVVSGLEVSCHPCGDGRVIVHPGYAIDCCGNDLTLACAQTLNVNAMVQALRRDHLGGYDCDDPCPEPEAHAAAAPAKGATAGAETDATRPATEFRYCLYLRYCEQPSDPVMPYSTGDDCGRASCEPTRVREGVKFELRCREMGVAPNELLARLCACLGDLNRLSAIFDHVGRLRRGTRVAKTVLTKPDPAVFNVANLQGANAWLDTVRARRAAPAAEARAAAAGRGETPAAAAAAADSPDFLRRLREISAQTRAFQRLTREEQQRLSESDRAVVRRAEQAVGGVLTDTVIDSAAAFREVRDWLIERLGNSPFVADCTLRQRVNALTLPPRKAELADSDTRSFAASIDELTEAVVGFVRDCLCRALNPPCAPCDDAGVLIACLDMEDCQVVRVCNLERSYVLSPAAVRYWLPPAQLLGNALERLCCDPLDRLLRDAEDEYGLDRGDRGGLDINALLKEEAVKMIEASLCVGGKLSGPIKDILDKIFPTRTRTPTPTPQPAGPLTPVITPPSTRPAPADEPTGRVPDVEEEDATETPRPAGASARAARTAAATAASKRARAATRARAAKPAGETAAAPPADAASPAATAGGASGEASAPPAEGAGNGGAGNGGAGNGGAGNGGARKGGAK